MSQYFCSAIQALQSQAVITPQVARINPEGLVAKLGAWDVSQHPPRRQNPSWLGRGKEKKYLEY